MNCLTVSLCPTVTMNCPSQPEDPKHKAKVMSSFLMPTVDVCIITYIKHELTYPPHAAVCFFVVSAILMISVFQREVAELNATYNPSPSTQASVHSRGSTHSGSLDWNHRSPQEADRYSHVAQEYQYQGATAQSNASNGSSGSNQSRGRRTTGRLSIDRNSSPEHQHQHQDMYAEQPGRAMPIPIQNRPVRCEYCAAINIYGMIL